MNTNEQHEAYEIATHLAMLAAGESVTIPDDVRALYARGAVGELSSDQIVVCDRREIYCKNGLKRKRTLPVLS